MSIRTLLLGLAALGLFWFALYLAAANEVRDVTIVKAGDGKVTLVTPDGTEHTVDVATDAKLTCDGKPCKLEDLHKGYKADVTGEQVDGHKRITAIEARSK